MTERSPAAARRKFAKMRSIALANHCRLSIETMHPRFRAVLPLGMSVIVTVNSGYE